MTLVGVVLISTSLLLNVSTQNISANDFGFKDLNVVTNKGKTLPVVFKLCTANIYAPLTVDE